MPKVSTSAKRALISGFLLVQGLVQLNVKRKGGEYDASSPAAHASTCLHDNQMKPAMLRRFVRCALVQRDRFLVLIGYRWPVNEAKDTRQLPVMNGSRSESEA